jgi:stage V sporulation protein AE
MVDDHGSRAKGPGEDVLEELARSDEIDLVGVVAVASNTAKVSGVPVVYSIDASGELIEGAVDKEGDREPAGHEVIEGDTVDVLNEVDVPIIVGIGDPGKMNHADESKKGARITTKAVEAVLRLWSESGSGAGRDSL